MTDAEKKKAGPSPAGVEATGVEATGAAAAGRTPAARPETDPEKKPGKPEEFGGPAGPEPTRYGDWERNGRVSDF